MSVSEQDLCITFSEASGTFQSLDSNKYRVQSVDVSIRAESLGEPTSLTVYLHQSQEPCQMQSRNIKTVVAAHHMACDHAHQDLGADPKARLDGGVTGTAAVEAEGVHITTQTWCGDSSSS